MKVEELESTGRKDVANLNKPLPPVSFFEDGIWLSFLLYSKTSKRIWAQDSGKFYFQSILTLGWVHALHHNAENSQGLCSC